MTKMTDKPCRDLTKYSTGCLLEELARLGCSPGIYYRGRGIWRAHINISGNFWGEGDTPQAAFVDAIRCWRKGDYILDGDASSGAKPRHAEMGEVW